MNIGPISPFFIVRDVVTATAFYRDKLGFEVLHLMPDKDPFFAVISRGSAQLFLKAISEQVQAIPNQTRHDWAPWDAFVYVDEPLTLAQEFAARETLLQSEVHEREDGLYGFEVQDEDGYVLFFGRTN